MTQTFVDSAPATSLRRTADGYLTGRVKCARTGVQVYRRGELALDGDPMELIRVYRPESAVFATDSLKTYGGKPIVMGHPEGGLVHSDNWAELAVGTVGSTITRDGETVTVDFAIMDAAAIAAVENGTREISMGYRCPIAVQDGVTPDGEPYGAVQVGPITINHLAVVPKARGGESLRIGDADSSHWGATPVYDHQEKHMTMKTVVLGDSAVQVAIADAAAVEAFRTAMVKKVADAEKAKADMESEKDEEIGQLKAKNKTLEDAAMSPEKLSKLIADRVALETTAKLLDAEIVCDGVSDDDLRKAVVVAKLGDAAVADASPAEITGMFKALSAAAPKHDDSARHAIGDAAFHNPKNTGGVWGDSIAAAAGVRFKKGA
jgi:uncharacterized protein